MVSVDFTIFIQWLNFGVLVLVLYLILFRPLMKFIDKRNAKLKDDIEGAKAGREEAERLRKEHQQKLTQLKVESLKFIEEAEKKAQTERENIIAGAHKEADRIIEGSRKEAQIQLNRVKQEIKKEIAGLVVGCASQVLEREVKKADHKNMISAFLEEEVKDVGE